MDPSSSLSLVHSKRKRDEDYSNEDTSSKRRRPVPLLTWRFFQSRIQPRPRGQHRKVKNRIGRTNRRLSGPATGSRFNRLVNDCTTVSTPMDASTSLSLVPYRDEDDSFDDDDDDDGDDDEPFHYCSKRSNHDVFLSYSNKNIGNSFVSHLKGALKDNFFDICDRTSLPIGQDRSSELLKAIEESWICVVVFSDKYPFSVECLDELVLIRDSISKSNNRRRVFPIFYKVIPSHVRSQKRGPFLHAFQAHHHNHVDGEKVEKWKLALEDVGKLAGHHFKTGANEDEEEFVRKIVKQLGKLKLPLELSDADNHVGIERRAKDLISTLRLDDPDPSITAVLGMSGSGKTTLVKAVYDRIVPDFDANCFIENVRYYKDDNWMLSLKRDVISRFNGVDYGIYNYNVLASSNIIKCVSNQKVLLVLDDVVKYEQLQALGIHDPASFAPGSRILVTTTNKHSLSGLKKYTSYDIELLNERESSELFTGLAYEKGQSADKKFVDEIVHLAGGLPLVLEVWGRDFKRHESKQWPSLLEKLRRIPHEDVQGKLKVSYDSLSPRAKNLFLDFTCFLDGMTRNCVIKILEDEDNAFFPDIEIQNLIDRGLIYDDDDDDDGDDLGLMMHAVIRDMGREVVRQENEDDPGKRSRLLGKDVVHVLRDCSGTDSVRSIDLEWRDLEEVVTVQAETFRKMRNLRYIRLTNILIQPQRSSSYSSSNDEIMSTPFCFKHLKYLEWYDFPFKSLDEFDMENVVVICLKKTRPEAAWEGSLFKNLKKLKTLDVDINGLRKGSFIGLENFEELTLTNLKKVYESNGSISCDEEYYPVVDLVGCEINRVSWEMIHTLTSLEKLNLSFCRPYATYAKIYSLPHFKYLIS